MARGINAPKDPELSELSRDVQPEKVMEMEAHDARGTRGSDPNRQFPDVIQGTARG